MTDTNNSRVQAVAAILWTNGDDCWEGRRPDWSEIVANPDFSDYRITVEEQAKSILYMTADDWGLIVQLRAEEDAERCPGPLERHQS